MSTGLHGVCQCHHEASLYALCAQAVRVGTGEQWQPLRVSTKLATARPSDLPENLRDSYLSILQSQWADHSLQGAIRPGCLNLILTAIQPVRCFAFCKLQTWQELPAACGLWIDNSLPCCPMYTLPAVLSAAGFDTAGKQA